MRKTLIALTLFATFSAGAAFAEDMEIKSADFNKGDTLKIEQVYKGFGCEGKNESPQLSFSGVPKEAKSLAVTVYDPDAPTGSGWWHWVVFNIPVDTKEIPAGASGTKKMPKDAIESVTDFGSTGFGGACPPKGHGKHRYYFTLWALDAPKLDLDAKASGAKVGYFLNAHKIQKAVTKARYGRE